MKKVQFLLFFLRKRFRFIIKNSYPIRVAINYEKDSTLKVINF